MKKSKFLFFLLTLVSLAVSAQISGTVQDSDGSPLPGASVVIKGTTTGSTTDFDGNFTINASNGDVLIYSYVGFETLEQAYDGTTPQVIMTAGLALDEVLLTGNRSKPRTAIDSAVPIDNIKTSELMNTGEASIERALTFAIPSFNSQDQAISDATAGFSPADLRGLGPSRTMVLINGKELTNNLKLT